MDTRGIDIGEIIVARAGRENERGLEIDRLFFLFFFVGGGATRGKGRSQAEQKWAGPAFRVGGRWVKSALFSVRRCWTDVWFVFV